MSWTLAAATLSRVVWEILEVWHDAVEKVALCDTIIEAVIRVGSSPFWLCLCCSRVLVTVAIGGGSKFLTLTKNKSAYSVITTMLSDPVWLAMPLLKKLPVRFL
ncbi:hypothetical protein FOMPIDRAFT_83117 [Fomitopsis schrenkii]|uniref:Uncharacterized protein n=1 Tax=Fomitopsis schrenkii TaxID=2126942 RepID=S8EJX5_FOMSC|nr:hypothetical protein FOMPIDRAFT_83117 [Fomitopsis schrenkii]